MDQITEEFYKTGLSFIEYLISGTEEERSRTMLYYNRSEKNFSSEELRIDLEYPIYLLVVACPWCWDCKTNLPILTRIAENSPKINIKFFNRDQYPFLIDNINGGKKIPQVLVYSQDFHYLDRWVERTTTAYQLYSDVRKEYGWEKDNFHVFLKEYRRRFLQNHKKIEEALIQEFRILLKRIDAIQSSTSRYFLKKTT